MAKESQKRARVIDTGSGPGDFYQRWRDRVRDWSEARPLARQLVGAGLAAPDLSHLLVRLMGDARIPLLQKAKLGVALAYVASPVDVLPDYLLGPIGILDDIAVVAWALQGLLREEHWGVVVEHWAGDERVLVLLRRAIDFLADNTGGRGIKAIKGVVGRAEDALSGRESGPVSPRKTITVLPGGSREGGESGD